MISNMSNMVFINGQHYVRFLFVFVCVLHINDIYRTFGNAVRIFADEHLSKLQVIQNKLLKLPVKLVYLAPTSLFHYNITVLKIVEIHIVNILFFVNECRARRAANIFKNYYTAHEATYEFKHIDRLFAPLATTELGFNWCAILGAKLWNRYFDEVNLHMFTKSSRKRVTKSFIAKYALLTLLTPSVSLYKRYVYVYMGMIWAWLFDTYVYMC